MRTPAVLCVAFCLFLAVPWASESGQSSLAGLRVAVIAPSLSTSREARAIRLKLKWEEVAARQADAVLVVVRSSLSYPLRSSYDSYKELENDANGQLNITGPKFHIYIYRINDDLSVSESEHRNYSAEDR
jgi:hypothetical protein